jgi:hypothetical protein
MNEIEAVRLSIRVWEWQAETGAANKYDNPVIKQLEEQGYNMFLYYNCPLCLYTGYSFNSEPEVCFQCPYFIRYKTYCHSDRQPYGKWENLGSGETTRRKLYAIKLLQNLWPMLIELGG